MPKTILVTITITVLAVIEFFAFCMMVGVARGRHGIQAPAVSGHPVFERYFRVQMNTLEQLIIFLPLLWVAGGLKLVAWYWVALIGALFLIGRLVYQRGYVAAPEKRSIGYVMGGLPMLALMVIDIVGVALIWVHSP